MTHSLSSLLGSGQSERIRGFGGVFLGGVIGEGGVDGEGWLARFFGMFRSVGNSGLLYLFLTLFTLFGCGRCKHKRLVTAIYQKGILGRVSFIFMTADMLDLLLANGQNPSIARVCYRIGSDFLFFFLRNIR